MILNCWDYPVTKLTRQQLSHLKKGFKVKENKVKLYSYCMMIQLK